MGNVDDLLVLLALIGAVGLWLKASAARERAVAEARSQCDRYGLQFLDESVGLRALRLRRIGGMLQLERSYGFEVSIDGADRAPASLWMAAGTLTELRLPTVLPTSPPPASTGHSGEDARGELPVGGNVVPLRPRRQGGEWHH